MFVENPCPPDIIGINHYLTSERYLDERDELFPEHHRSGNARDRYADVEAVRIDFEGRPTGPLARLREVWERYGLPIAVTEVHHRQHPRRAAALAEGSLGRRLPAARGRRRPARGHHLVPVRLRRLEHAC